MCHSMLPSVSARASSDSALSAGKSPAWGTSWDDLCEHNVAPNPTAVASKLKVHAFPMVVDPVTAAAAQAPAASAGVLLHINTTATTSTGPRFTMVHGGIGTRIDVSNAPIGSGASSIISASGAAMSAVSAAFPRPPVTSQYGALSSAGGQGAPACIQHRLGTDSKHQRAHTKLEDQEARCIDTDAGACALPGSGRSTNGSSGASEWSATTRVDAGRDSACIPAASLLCSPDDSVDNMSVCASQSPRAEGGASCGSAAAAAPTADVHAKAAATATLLSAVTRQLLERAATRRPGAQSLTAAPPSAPRSTRSRLLVTQLSVYPCAQNGGGCCGDAALAHANRLLSLGMLPGGIQYMPVLPGSFMLRAGRAWQFPAYVVCLASSYMQRVLVALPQLSDAARAVTGFEEHLPTASKLSATVVPGQLPPLVAAQTRSSLRSVQCACLVLALKVADREHAGGLLRFMLNQCALRDGRMATVDQANHIEACVLDALGWRLGPYFAEDVLAGNDEEMWAAAAVDGAV